MSGVGGIVAIDGSQPTSASAASQRAWQFAEVSARLPPRPVQTREPAIGVQGESGIWPCKPTVIDARLATNAFRGGRRGAAGLMTAREVEAVLPWSLSNATAALLTLSSGYTVSTAFVRLDPTGR